ncbi:MAG: hypothetical protein J0M02_16345, partial [Planctomycetes bacterium]|nr:hypothetical protein [Planctomycetota bacterium]
MSDRLILTIAPILRGLLADSDAVLPAVSFSAEGAGEVTINVAADADADDAAALAALRTGLGGRVPASVAVP